MIRTNKAYLKQDLVNKLYAMVTRNPPVPIPGQAVPSNAERDRKLEEARAMRRQPQPARHSQPPLTTACETEHRERLAGVQGAGNEATWSPERLTLMT